MRGIVIWVSFLEASSLGEKRRYGMRMQSRSLWYGKMILSVTKIHKNIAIIDVCDKEIACTVREEPGERYESHTDYSISQAIEILFLTSRLMQSRRFIC